MARRVVRLRGPASIVASSAILLIFVSCGESRSPFSFAADTGEDTSDGECFTDEDCPLSEECWAGTCEDPICGAPLPTGIDGITRGVPVNRVCSEDESDWDDDFEEGDGDGDPWTCVSKLDCNVGEACSNGVCLSPEALPACAGPSVTELAANLATEAPVRDLTFVDFDADARDELVLLLDGLLLIVDDVDTSSTTLLAQLDLLTAARIDDDEVPDLLVASRGSNAAALVLGSPDNLPTTIEALSLGDTVLNDVVGVDWLAGGADELALTSMDFAIAPTWLTDLSTGTPTQTPIEGVVGTRVATIDLGVDAVPELLFTDQCRVLILAADGVALHHNLDAADCDFAVGRFAEGVDKVVALTPGNGIDLLTDIALDETTTIRAVAGAHARAFSVSVAGWSHDALLLSDPDASLVWSSGGAALDCHAAVPELATTVHAASGDFDGDGFAELATIDSLGVAHLWAIAAG